jgi:hypothetical protein
MAGVARQVARGFKWVDEVVEILDPVWKGAIALGIGSLAWLAMDRAVPFEVLQVYPAQARPGEQVQIVAKVSRDVSRGCASDMSRYIFDGRGTRWDEQTRHFSADTIELMSKQSPDMLRVSVTVPLDAYPGAASVVSDLEYRCNITHAVWPIRSSVVMPFTILPRD